MYITRMKLAMRGLDLKPDLGVETAKFRGIQTCVFF